MRKPRGSMNGPRSGSLAGTSMLRCLRRVSTWPQVPRRTPSGWSTGSRVARAARMRRRSRSCAPISPRHDRRARRRPPRRRRCRISRRRRSASARATGRPAPAPAMLPSGAPRTVALLLPLTGRHRAIGTAVRDGFVAACLADPADVRPRVTIYDTAASGVVASYQQAVTAGAQFIVGPLMKDELLVLVAGGQFPVPTLALNTLRVAFRGLPFPVFARPGRGSARGRATHCADGRLRGVALFPENDWDGACTKPSRGARKGGCRAERCAILRTRREGLRGPAARRARRFGGCHDRPADKSKPPEARSARRGRVGPQFVSSRRTPRPATGDQAQLRFQMTYPMAVYATSDAWEASSRAAADMEGLVYRKCRGCCLAARGDGLWDLLHGAWSEVGRGRLRLYAFGYDAFRLTGELRSAAGASVSTASLASRRRAGRTRVASRSGRAPGRTAAGGGFVRAAAGADRRAGET